MDAFFNGIFFQESGRHDGPAVLFIHGMLFDHKMWLPQKEACSRDFRVIAMDMRGHGRSDPGDGQYTYRMLVEDIISLLDHLQIKKAILCGLSMGGSVALRTMELYPDRVRALALCDCHGGADGNEAKCWRELAIKEIKKGGVCAFCQSFLEKVFAPATFSDRPEAVKMIRSTVLAASPLAVCGALLAQAARTDTTAGYSKINVPTLLLVGEEDRLTPPTLMYRMHEQIPGSEYRIISAAGHVSNLENPEEFNHHLLGFLHRLG